MGALPTKRSTGLSITTVAQTRWTFLTPGRQRPRDLHQQRLFTGIRINSGSGSIYPDSSGSSYPIQWGDVPTLPATQFTAVSEVERNDGSIGTLVIPSLGIRYKAYDGTDSASMRKGWATSPAQAPGRETSVCADTTGLQPQHRRNQGSGNWRYHSVSDQPGDKDLCGEFGQDHRLD